MNDTEIDQHLDDVALKHLTWKPTIMRVIACRIVTTALHHGSAGIWPDEINIADILNVDKNCVGSAWRFLRMAGVIAESRNFRRSKSPASRGRNIFQHWLASEAKARMFLARNGQAQGELL